MLKIPPIVVGTSHLGSVLPDGLMLKSEREKALRHLDALLDAGCTAFDLAASYQIGGTERLFGHWLASRRNRDRLLLIGKGAHPYPFVRPNRLNASAITADLDATLKRLGVERLDLYLMHRDFPGASLEPVVAALSAGRQSGKFLAWGVSNWTDDRIRAIDALAQRSGLPPIAVSSPHFSLVDWVHPPWRGSVSIAGPTNGDARAFYARAQLHVLAWSPLGSGFLATSEADSRDYRSHTNIARRERAQALAKERGVTLAQMGLAYLFNQPFPVSAVISARNVERMRANLEAASIRLSPSDIRALEGNA